MPIWRCVLPCVTIFPVRKNFLSANFNCCFKMASTRKRQKSLLMLQKVNVCTECNRKFVLIFLWCLCRYFENSCHYSNVSTSANPCWSEFSVVAVFRDSFGSRSTEQVICQLLLLLLFKFFLVVNVCDQIVLFNFLFTDMNLQNYANPYCCKGGSSYWKNGLKKINWNVPKNLVIQSNRLIPRLLFLFI